MLAKSLIVFTGVGVISGLAFGIYLLDIKNTGQLVFVEGPSLSIVTGKSDFERGETIGIRIVNSGDVPLSFSDPSYGLRVTGLSGILMYSPPVPTNAPAGAARPPLVLEPGDGVDFSWDQIKDNGGVALEGLYKISAMGADDHGNRVEKSTVVTILK